MNPKKKKSRNTGIYRRKVPKTRKGIFEKKSSLSAYPIKKRPVHCSFLGESKAHFTLFSQLGNCENGELQGFAGTKYQFLESDSRQNELSRFFFYRIIFSRLFRPGKSHRFLRISTVEKIAVKSFCCKAFSKG